MNGLASFSPHETESNMCLPCQYALWAYFILNYTWRVLCIWLPTNTPPKYCCLWMLKDWRASSNCLTKGPANSLSVTVVLLIISSFCSLAFNQCLFYRLSHVFFHLLDVWSMPWTTGWYSQCIPMPYMVAPSSSGWLTIISHMGHHSCSRITGWLELCSSSENPIWMGGATARMPATILCGYKFAGWPPDFCGWLFW